jgi:hypothetical protein
MDSKLKKDFGVVAKSCEFNMYELVQMEEMCEKITHILDNHKDEKEKKQFISDEDLLFCKVILETIVGGDAPQRESSFTNALKAIEPYPLAVDDVE